MDKKTPKYYETHKDKYERKSVYSGFSWFLVTFLGVSALPRRIEFYNKKTGELIAAFDDKATRKKYIGRY